jgi:hypothetical protein
MMDFYYNKKLLHSNEQFQLNKTYNWPIMNGKKNIKKVHETEQFDIDGRRFIHQWKLTMLAWLGVSSVYHRIHYDDIHRKCDYFSYELKQRFINLTSIKSGVSVPEQPTSRLPWVYWHRHFPSSFIYLLEWSVDSDEITTWSNLAPRDFVHDQVFRNRESIQVY